MSTDKVGQNSAQYDHDSGNIPVGYTEAFLSSIDDDGEILILIYRFRIEKSVSPSGVKS